MMNANEVVTGVVRVSYVNLFEAKVINPNGAGANKTPVFSLQMLIPKTDAKTLNDLGLAVLEARKNGVTLGKKPFANLSQAVIDSANLTWKDGDAPMNAEKNPEGKGHWILSAKANADRPPGIVDAQGKDILAMHQTQVYSGMYAHVHVQLFPYVNSGNIGIGVSLQNVQKVKDGEALGATRTPASQVFGAIAGADVSASPFGVPTPGTSF